MNLLQFPLTRIVAGFIPGIVTAYYFPIDVLTAMLSLLAAFIILLASLLFANTALKKILFGFIALLLSYSIGLAAYVTERGVSDQRNYIHQLKTPNQLYTIEVVLREKLKTASGRQRYFALIRSIDGVKANGKILINFPKETTALLQVGCNLLIVTKITEHRPNANPGGFDYGKYLANKSVYAQVYPNRSQIKILPQIDHDFYHYADRIRTKMIDNLGRSGFHKSELAVISALILGQQQEISKDILQDYQYAGAVHILSVSGLHVGFILLFINYLLKGLPKNRKCSLLRLVIVLVALWGFGLLTGFSPSVVRSVTMFSFVACGMYLRRGSNIFHTLLVSLLLILAIKPSFLFDVGFQLSYVALFFILWLQPMLGLIWQPRYKILIYFRDILTVSFAAQIGALPLSIYYFHQVAGLFFITNMVVIPFLGVIMILGVMVFALAAFDCVPFVAAKLLEWLIYALNSLIRYIASFDNFVIVNLPFNGYMMAAAYFAIISIVLWTSHRKYKNLILALVAIISFQAAISATIIVSQDQEELTVFNIKKNTVVTIRKGRSVLALSARPITENQALQSYLTTNFCNELQKGKLDNVLQFNNSKILIVDSVAIVPKRIKPDILLLTQNSKINLERAIHTLNPKTVVADGSNFWYTVRRWEATCVKEKIPFHYTGEKGFYQLKQK